jgi:hypothetical protein
MKLKNTTLTGLVKYLNTNFKKKSGAAFTASDVQGYIRRGRLPSYMDAHAITASKLVKDVKLYNLE